MKKNLLFLLLFSLVVKIELAQTSVYRPFPTTNAYWSETIITSSSTIKYQYGIFGDTLIGSSNYHKIYQRNIICWDTTMSASNSNLVGAMREDGLKRVYYYPLNLSSFFCTPGAEYKIYDFSKQAPGDTIQFATSASPCYPIPYLTINHVDSILIRGNYRKRFHFDEGETWIEGIGSARSLLSMITPYPTCSCTNALLCNKQNDTLYYINSTYNYCYCNLGINVNELKEESAINVFPNPFSTETTLTTNINLINATLTVYNSLEQEVKQIKNISGKTIILTRDNLPHGLYFIRITQNDNVYLTKKLVITNN